MKKIIALMLSLIMVLSLVACAAPAETDGDGEQEVTKVAFKDVIKAELGSVHVDTEGVDYSKMKIGFIHVSDPSDMGYTYNHNNGTLKMIETLGLDADTQIINKFNIPEDNAQVIQAANELIAEGCNLIFATSFGHESGIMEVAAQNPDVQFCHATGYLAASSGLANHHNYFGRIYEARYLSGIVAGLKAKEIGNNVLGYVAAMPFAEVISGFTAFYLGAKSVNPDVTMKVMYTGSWNDPTKEGQNAAALIDAGCGVISQHCDSTAPATAAEDAGVFHIGYNSAMIDVAPNASMTSAIWDWSQYLVYATTCVAKGEPIDVDWMGGLYDGVCLLSDMNEGIVAEGTAEAVKAAYEGILAGEVQPFAGPYHGEGVDFDGNTVTIDVAEGEWYVENEVASAPSFNYIIDGVEVIG
ncbi:MAG: BMP family ABC transporter substrate-binding protein [Clostridia bacterium]|nr:BMP family ABC transporter substrate-binding protein [Clostridia bacterium]